MPCSAPKVGSHRSALRAPPTPSPPAVTHCEPRLECLAELSQLLRQENRFADFVKAARRGFAALVQREIEDEEEREEAAAAGRA